MRISPKRNALAQFDREQYADWLWRGLRAFYSRKPAERIGAFDHVGLIIAQQDSVCEGLTRVYEEYVPESRKLSFRRAIGDVLREQTNNQDAPIEAFQDLIYLIMRIRASESLGSLLPAVGNGLVGRRQPEIFYETLAALRLLAPSAQAFEVARGLVVSANFDDGYLFEATKVLVECEPSSVSAIVLEFEPRLSELRQACLELGGDEWIAFCEGANDWAEYLLTLGPGSWLSQLCQKADQMTDPVWILELFCENYHSSSGSEYWLLRETTRRLVFGGVRDWAYNPNDKVNALRIHTEDGGPRTVPLAPLIQGQLAHLVPESAICA
jgi:hypothetical protein